MGLDQQVANLKEKFDEVNDLVNENPHDPRVLDLAVKDYRALLAVSLGTLEIANDEINRLQKTIYSYYLKNDRA
jgi:hypothetical protein